MEILICSGAPGSRGRFQSPSTSQPEANLNKSTHCYWGTRKGQWLHTGRDILGDSPLGASDSSPRAGIITTFPKRKWDLKEITHSV